jgi:hypothetical protein
MTTMPNNVTPADRTAFPRGEGPWNQMTESERAQLDSIPIKDFTILSGIIPRLWIPAPLAEPVLALEVITGDFRGVIFSYKDFQIMPAEMEGGWVPTKFGLKVWRNPTDLNLDDNQAFDVFTREVLLAWLSFIATNDLKRTVSSRPVQGIH